MSRFLSKKLNLLQPYTPGEQPQDMQYIKLNTNENPYPPSPKVIKAITKAECSRLRLYSDPQVKPLVSAIARANGVGEENVIVSNGSDEILAFAFYAFCLDKPLAMPDVSYGFYPVLTDLFGIEKHTIPLTDTMDIDTYSFTVNDGENVVIANPNAPTGKALSKKDIESIVQAHHNDVVIIDEAYVDFGAQSVVPLIFKYENLLVVQTCSKSRNLAGARVGFAMASKTLIDDLNRVRYSFNPYNVNRLSMCAAVEAVSDIRYFKSCTGKIIKTRQKTTDKLRKRGFEVIDSSANFVFAKSDKLGGEELYKALKKNGVLVRWFDGERTKDYVRITIGSESEIKTFFEKLDIILKK